MIDRSFPERPASPGFEPVGTSIVVRREPLAAIREILSVTIDDIVNDPRVRWRVRDFYRITRWIENELWLRRELHDLAGPRAR